MTKDLEATLSELGTGYRELALRMRAPFEEGAVHRNSSSIVRRSPFSRAMLVAASLTLVLALSALFIETPAPRRAYTAYTVAYADDEFALQAILDSQRNDGSWSNDFITMQNAAALRRARDEASRIAYKRAVRYLKTKGLGPISDAELLRRRQSLGDCS